MIHYRTQQSKIENLNTLLCRKVGRNNVCCVLFSPPPISCNLTFGGICMNAYRWLPESICMQRHYINVLGITTVEPLLCQYQLHISVHNNPGRSQDCLRGSAEYFKTSAYCSCSENLLFILKTPVAASSLKLFPPLRRAGSTE